MNKPKPNTRFLRNLVKETDSHNAALLAKEAADSKTKLRELAGKKAQPERDIRARQLGAISALLTGNATKQPRTGGRLKDIDEQRRESERGMTPRDQSDKHNKRSGEGDRRRHQSRESLRDRSSDRDDRRSERRSHSARDDDKDLTSSRRHRSDRGRLSPPSDDYKSWRSHRSSRRSRSRSRSRSPRRSRHKDSKRRERSPRESRRRHDEENEKSKSNRDSKSSKKASKDYDSDPLEEIIGPLPPPKVVARGRGAASAASGIDSRFAEQYDPKLDLSAGDNESGDDWDMVLDLVKWRQQGADRLRAAGFTDREIEGWETGKKAEVKYSKSGETREWDRGKSFDELP